MDQNTFMETIHSVAEIIKVAETPMTQREILSYFSDMNLSKEQENIVLDYLSKVEEEEEKEAAKEETAQGDAVQMDEETSGQEAHEDSKVFRMYLEELEQVKRYSQIEELELYNALLQGDESAIEKLLDVWLSNVLEIAKGYLTPKLHIEDLVQEGNMALFMALQNLCGSGPNDNCEEILRAAVEEAVMNYASEISGVKEAEEAMLAKVRLVHTAKKLLEEEQGGEPSVMQLAEYTKMSEEELTDILELLKEQK